MLRSVDLIVPNVREAAIFLENAFGLTASVVEDRFAELDAGSITLMLSPDAMVATEPVRGVILHLEVPDVEAAAARAKAAGAVVVQDIVTTDWGTESVMFAGPADLLVDCYRKVG